MNNNREQTQKNDAIEVDVKRVFKAVWSRIWLVCLCAILCGAIAFLTTLYFITPMYQSTAMFYVNNGFSVSDAYNAITSGDITAAKSLVDTYIVILNSRSCLNDVIDYANVDLSYSELKKMIAASSVNETEVFQVIVTSSDPAEAENLANAIAYILPKRINDIVDGTTAKIVDYAIQSSTPSSPNRVSNTLAGVLLGGVLCILTLAVHEIFDLTIRSQDDIEQCCKHPILASVPDMTSPSTGGYYYYNTKNSKKKKGAKPQQTQNTVTIGKKISFSALEAYKLLRTKLQFSFVDDLTCPVIGVSSALAGEGKSLSAINLAYSLSQLEKRVLLIDCDLRRPSLSVKLPIQKTPGLSEYLTGHATMDDATQFCRVDNEGGFAIIASGHNPPNPIELLSSTKMQKAIEQLRGFFDYIILDLPPVGEVSDAMVAAKLTDGILLVVRENYCNTAALTSAVSQFEFIESRILGLVLNCVGEHSGKYYYRYYGKKYARYGRYGRYYRSAKYRYAAYAEERAKNAGPQAHE